jgi:hypothetical protein
MSTSSKVELKPSLNRFLKYFAFACLSIIVFSVFYGLLGFSYVRPLFLIPVLVLVICILYGQTRLVISNEGIEQGYPYFKYQWSDISKFVFEPAQSKHIKFYLINPVEAYIKGGHIVTLRNEYDIETKKLYELLIQWQRNYANHNR